MVCAEMASVFPQSTAECESSISDLRLVKKTNTPALNHGRCLSEESVLRSEGKKSTLDV